MKTESRYLDGTYFNNNPDWDRSDAPWKASKVESILRENKMQPYSICEVGCGSGDILRCLRKSFPLSKLFGYDISPQAAQFWNDEKDEALGIKFNLGDFSVMNEVKHDLILMLDVFEHVRDPYTFLEKSRTHGKKFIFIIPLDLNSFSVARKAPLMECRRKVGHLSFYTKDLAIETLKDCGFNIIEWRYTGLYCNHPSRGWKTRLAAFPRQLMYWLNKDAGVRILGGESLLVLAD